MSRTRQYTIHCDGPAAGAWCSAGADGYEATVTFTEYRNEAEAVARHQGWQLGRRDLCPVCRHAR